MEIPKKNNLHDRFKKMSILIARDGFSFCVSAKNFNKAVPCVEKKFDKPQTPGKILREIEHAFQAEKIVLGEMKKISIVYANNLYAFVPTELFDENHLSDYLKFNVKILATDFLAHDFLKNENYVNVFVPYANINNYFFEKFGPFEYKHSATLLAENVLNNPSTEESMHVHVFWRHFDMVVAKQGKLLLCNSFFFETAEDFVYYILFVAEQFKLDTEQFPLQLSGKISEGSETYKLLCDYVRNCSLSKNNGKDQSAIVPNDFPTPKTQGCE